MPFRSPYHDDHEQETIRWTTLKPDGFHVFETFGGCKIQRLKELRTQKENIQRSIKAILDLRKCDVVKPTERTK